MPLFHRIGWSSALLGLLACLAGTVGNAVAGDTPRVRQSFDAGWRFQIGDIEAAASREFDDSEWSGVDVPHDWSITLPRDPQAPSGGGGGFFQTGVGWYRKTFTLPKSLQGRRLFIHFDGVFMNSDVWINGRPLGHRDYGYIGFRYDITNDADFDGTNVIAVRVDNSHQPHERWYTGSGIYRHVWLIATSDLHVDQWGTYVTTPMVSADGAEVTLDVTLVNHSSETRDVMVTTRILDAADTVVETRQKGVRVGGRGNYAPKTQSVQQELLVKTPHRWSVDTPYLYRAVTTIQANGELLDRYETPFGIRSIRFDSEQGFLLNEKKLVLKGVCLHHDAGALGAAVPRSVWKQRLQQLKDMGCNAVRLAHNPHAPEVLDLCDRLGLLVFDECYDKWNRYTDRKTQQPYWDFFTTWQRDLGDFIRRDRNHPSVFIWSVGNEVHQQLREPVEAMHMLRSLVDFVHKVEPSRKVTCALHPGHDDEDPTEPSPIAHVMDIVSYNYRSQSFGLWHRRFPNLVWIATEEYPYQSKDDLYLTADQFVNRNTFNYLQPFVAGQFIWSGFDYLGEGGGWPSKGWRRGLIDTTGFRKPVSYLTESFYSDEKVVRIVVMHETAEQPPVTGQWGWPSMASHWNWPAGSQLRVAVFTNCERVELTLNDKSLGSRSLADVDNHTMFWRVPYEPGTLHATGYYGSLIEAFDELQTANEPARITLDADRQQLIANGSDLTYVTVRIVDDAGQIVPTARHLIHFSVTGAGRIQAIDNGDLLDQIDFTSSDRETRCGRCIVILRAPRTPGTLELTAAHPDLGEAVLELPVSSE